MTIVDKIMLSKVLKFQISITECYDKLDLRGAYRLTKKFIIEELTGFYLEFAKERLLMNQVGSNESLSTQMVYA